jgi:amino acid transporter
VSLPGVEPWEFAGWGRAERISDLDTDLAGAPAGTERRHTLLGPWRATAICGNDITSSVLYVSALSVAQAGALAPVALVAVAAVLFLYRKIYAEVGSALPLNGGTYTVLLNTTSKRVSAAAACLTLLSYLATSVISAHEAMHYAHNVLPSLHVTAATIGVLGFFALASLVGISESAVIALAIFAIHLVTLTALSISAGIVVSNDPSLLLASWSRPAPVDLPRALFFGFSAAMLGISGFESSANFIEEQAPGVFPKTLRNMWVAVSVFNPLVCLLALGLIPLSTIQQVPPDLLARMGAESLGAGFASWVSIDAVLVLSGAVLTSYVGVTGLVRRMAIDGCLPQFLLRRNRARGTNHWIILAFFALCVSILLITRGQITTLAGVYTLSFLSVMALFAVGNMLLKQARAQLPRTVRASWPTVAIALFCVLIGLLGNVLLDPLNVEIFALYLGLALLGVGIMFERIGLLKIALLMSRTVTDRLLRVSERFRASVRAKIQEINGLAVVYFSKSDDIAVLNRAALYVLRNEPTNRMKVVYVYRDEAEIPPDLAGQLATVDRMYPQLRIDFLAVKGTFCPELIDRLSKRLGVPKNYMFIGTPGNRFPHRIEALGGVRVIL